MHRYLTPLVTSSQIVPGTQGSTGPGAAPPDTAPGLADPTRIARATAIDHRATDGRRLHTPMRAPPSPDHPAAGAFGAGADRRRRPSMVTRLAMHGRCTRGHRRPCLAPWTA